LNIDRINQLTGLTQEKRDKVLSKFRNFLIEEIAIDFANYWNQARREKQKLKIGDNDPEYHYSMMIKAMQFVLAQERFVSRAHKIDVEKLEKVTLQRIKSLERENEKNKISLREIMNRPEVYLQIKSFRNLKKPWQFVVNFLDKYFLKEYLTAKQKRGKTVKTTGFDIRHVQRTWDEIIETRENEKALITPVIIQEEDKPQIIKPINTPKPKENDFPKRTFVSSDPPQPKVPRFQFNKNPK